MVGSATVPSRSVSQYKAPEVLTSLLSSRDRRKAGWLGARSQGERADREEEDSRQSPGRLWVGIWLAFWWQWKVLGSV